MDPLVRSCELFETYPQNLVHQTTSGYILRAYLTRLKDQKDRLFHDESHAALDFLELNDGDEEFSSSCVENTNRLKEQLREAFKPTRTDPRCRFIFMHARNSRDPLRISHNMFTLALTYHQVMPSFLDFIFPFGRQEYAQDFHFSGLRHENCLNPLDKGLNVPELGRSGREIRLCYNLQSVEKSGGQADLPWLIRQTAIYHSFDVETGRSVWINVKGNKLLKKRIEEASKLSQLGSFKSISRSFAATLTTHMIFCDWAGENWRWYVTDLEKVLQEVTRKTVSTPVDRLSSSGSESTSIPIIPRTQATLSVSHQETLSRPPSRPHSSSSQAQSTTSERSFASKIQFSPFQGLRLEMPSSLMASRLPNVMVGPPESQPGSKPKSNELRPGLQDEDNTSQQENFSFTDLQRIQYIEEKTREALLVLKQNVTVLKELREHYRSTTEAADLPGEIKSDCRTDIARFEDRILGVERDLGMQQLRIESMLRLLADRKNLLYGILQYRGLQASESFTQEARRSIYNMDAMATSMHEIAEKTKQETVSMRIITLVTLFFLPGISIATFMSTGIIQFTTDNDGRQKRVFQLQGLKLYLAICLPVTIATFVAWYIVYWWVRRKDRSSPYAADDGKCSDKA